MTGGANVPEVVVLIPAFNPGSSLLDTVEDLAGLGFRDFVVVNDGSRPASECIFDRLAARDGCEVLHHAVNLGKGRALKTGLNHFLLKATGGSGIFEAPISTIYLEGNRSSHFNLLRDSMRIYFVLLRFSFSSLLAAAVETRGVRGIGAL